MRTRPTKKPHPQTVGTNLSNKLKGEEKRARLLQAAGEVFAERGYRGATFREICQRAKVSLASINYHFRDKRSLYLEAFRHAADNNDATFRSGTIPNSKRPSDNLRHMIGHVLRVAFDQRELTWYSKLFARELAEPTGVLDVMVLERIRPGVERLKSIVQDVLGPNSEQMARLSAFCIIAIVGYFQANQRMIAQMYPDDRFDSGEFPQPTELLTQFVLAGIESFKKILRSQPSP